MTRMVVRGDRSPGRSKPRVQPTGRAHAGLRAGGGALSEPWTACLCGPELRSLQRMRQWLGDATAITRGTPS
jgi:hypothetical protein